VEPGDGTAATRAPERALLCDERGLVLVLALGILLVLSIMLATVVYFTTAGSQDAETKNAGQKAYAVAEAGLNSAFAQLATHYPNTTTAGSAAWVSSPGAQSYGGGTVNYSGTWNGGTQTWTLTGTGSVQPAGANSPLVRTATARVPVTIATSLSYMWGFFMGDASAPCSTFDNGAVVKISVYVASCLTFSGNAKILEPTTGTLTIPVYVGGLLNMGDMGSSSIGSSSTDKVLSVTAIGGCKFHTVAYACSSSSSSQVWAQSYPTSTSSITLPTVDLTGTYASANWSAATCSTGSNPFDNDATRNSSKATYRPLNGASFDCSAKNAAGATVGRLAWDSTTKVLTVSGTVFIDASTLTIQNNDTALYSGSGTIYVNGTVSFSNSGSLCGPGTGSTASAGCTANGWNPDTGGLMIIAGNAASVTPAFTMNGASMFEGIAYANGFYQGNNGAAVRGSVLAKNGQIQGASTTKAISTVPMGAPGSSYVLGTPDFS